VFRHYRNELRDDDHRLFPLLETISVLAKTLGIGFQKYAGAVYSRCVKIVERTFIAVEVCMRKKKKTSSFRFCL
jgi:hypothetical protein